MEIVSFHNVFLITRLIYQLTNNNYDTYFNWLKGNDYIFCWRLLKMFKPCHGLQCAFSQHEDVRYSCCKSIGRKVFWFGMTMFCYHFIIKIVWDKVSLNLIWNLMANMRRSNDSNKLFICHYNKQCVWQSYTAVICKSILWQSTIIILKPFKSIYKYYVTA